jgi:hypothetical protein
VKHWPVILLSCLVCAATLPAMGHKEAREKKSQISTIEITQGVRGRVEIWEGDFMPMTDPHGARGKILPGAGRRVRVYVSLRAADGNFSAKLDSVTSSLIAETTCDSLGHFEIALPPGKYSIFAEEKGGWYFNGWSGDGVQGAVTVDAQKVSEILIKITNKATF